MRARILRKHPPGENTLLRLVNLDFVHLDEGGRYGHFGFRPGIADAWRDFQRAERRGFADLDFKRLNTRGHLVERGVDSDFVLDFFPFVL